MQSHNLKKKYTSINATRKKLIDVQNVGCPNNIKVKKSLKSFLKYDLEGNLTNRITPSPMLANIGFV
jgi:hypothetical protein